MSARGAAGHRGLSRRLRQKRPAVAFPGAPGRDAIKDCFERSVTLHPEAVAFGDGGSPLTYAEVDDRAARIARALAPAPARRDVPVALMLRHGPAAIVGVLGTLKAGHFYQPLDPYNPPERIRALLEASGARVILADRDPGGASLPRGVLVLRYEEALHGPRANGPAVPVAPDAPAALFYTSGSTGEPKGVLHTHSSLLHGMAQQIASCRIGPGDRVANLLTYTAGWSVSIFLAPLLAGATVVSYDLRDGVQGLPGWIARERVTVLSCPATVYREMLRQAASPGDFATVRLLQIGGEPLHRRDVEAFAERFGPECLLGLSMGMCEHSGAVARVFVKGDTVLPEDRAPAGYPPRGVEVTLLDESGAPISAPGQAGEIAVRGPSLFREYWRRPDLTEAAFAEDPLRPGRRLYRTGDLGRFAPDGCLYVLGRKDDRAKVRGHRVDPAEVEAHLHALSEVARAAVVVRPGLEGDARLVAYVVPAGPGDLTAGHLRRRLAERLPSAAIPSAIVFLDRLPLAASGKVDRARLPLPDGARPALDGPFVAARTPLEEALAALWSSMLDVREVGVCDDFFELGGDSLLAARMLARLHAALGAEIPLRAFFASPTVEGLAALIVAAAPA